MYSAAGTWLSYSYVASFSFITQSNMINLFGTLYDAEANIHYSSNNNNATRLILQSSYHFKCSQQQKGNNPVHWLNITRNCQHITILPLNLWHVHYCHFSSYSSQQCFNCLRAPTLSWRSLEDWWVLPDLSDFDGVTWFHGITALNVSGFWSENPGCWNI